MAIGTTAAILGATGIGSSLLSGIFGAKKAKQAAQIQSEAATRVAEEARRVSGEAASDVRVEGEAAGSRVEETGTRAVERVDTATAAANELLRGVYGEAETATQPYREAGAGAVTTLRDLTQEGADKFTFTQEDPSFKFRLQEGLQALERSAAARGVLASGGTFKGITNYAQQAASQEYQNAFNRFMAQRTQRLSTLRDLAAGGLAGTEGFLRAGSEYGGRTSANITRGAEVAGGFETGAAESAGRFRVGAASEAGGLRMRGTEIAGEAALGGANARAAGKVGAANAWGGALEGIASTGRAFALRDLLPKPSRKLRYFDIP